MYSDITYSEKGRVGLKVYTEALSCLLLLFVVKLVEHSGQQVSDHYFLLLLL